MKSPRTISSPSLLKAVSSPSGSSPEDADARALFGARRSGIDLQGPIAAVGANTGGSGGHAYVIGFGLAAQVLLRSLTWREASGDPEEFIPEDALIHPLAYCARHFVELFLKDVPHELHALRNAEFKSEEHHDIQKLWGAFDVACCVDRRLREFPDRLRDAVMAIAALDPTGQTFRYRNNRDNEQHLRDLAVIYVPEFERSFMRMFDTVKELYAHIEGLQWEYSLGTYTENLSRSDLMEVAQRLGEAAKEGKQALRSAQVSICADFSLSRRQYHLAREQIDNHYGLSQRAGKERPLKDLTSETLGVTVVAIFVEEAASLLAESDVAAIWGVLSVGDVLGGSEDYDPQVQAFLDRKIPTGTQDVLRALRNKPTQLRKGLARLGQMTLLEALDSMVPLDELLQIEEHRWCDRWHHQ